MMAKRFFCGLEHEMKCPLIRAYEYRADGSISRIEFVTVADWSVKAPEPAALPVHPTRQ